MALREHGDLGQVCDADHLPAARHRRQGAPDRVGGRAADASVDLVEQVGVHVVGVGEDTLHGEEHAR